MGVSARALRAGRAIIELSLLTGPVDKGLRSLQAKAARVGQQFSKLGQLGIGTGGLASLRNLFVGSAASAALAWPVKMAGDLEVAAAQLGVFVGGADVARRMLAELQEFSDISMLPFEDLSKTAALLVRYGQTAEEATKNTEALAVLAAGDTDEFQKLALAFAQVGSAGRLQGEEMRQFKNTAFNPLREIAERTGESMEQVKKRMEAGGISFAEVANALQMSVGPAGRFHGLLDAISKTMLGQMRKAWSSFKRAVLPLGQQVLPTITRFFQAVNGAMPSLAAFIKHHAAAASIILGVLAAIAAGAVVFTTMGLGIQLLTVAATGMGAVFGIVATLLAAILSPAGLVVTALAALTAWFFNSTQAGQQMVTNLMSYFGALLTTARQTMTGMADALTAGDVVLAAQILWAGLQLAWQQGTDRLERLWLDFKDVGVRTIIELMFDLKRYWLEGINWLQIQWSKLLTKSASIGEQVGHYLTKSSDPQLAADQDRAHNQAMERIRNEGLARQQQIENDKAAAMRDLESARDQAQRYQDDQHNEELSAAQKELDDAKKRLAELNKQAAAEAANLPPGKEWFGATNLMPVLDAGLTKAKDAVKPVGTFDPRLARQIFGANSREDTELLTKIEHNTRKLKSKGGLPVV